MNGQPSNGRAPLPPAPQRVPRGRRVGRFLDGLLFDLQTVFLNEEQPVDSMHHILSALLVLWAVNPESIYYRWSLWAVLMGIWLLFALYQTKGRILFRFLKSGAWFLALWPAYTLCVRFFLQGTIHRKYLAIAGTLLIGSYYLLEKKYKAFKVLAFVGVFWMSLVALTTSLTYLSLPNIARELAPGRGQGNLQASALLGNFQAVYSALPLLVALLGAGALAAGKGPRWVLWGLALGQILFVAFSRYDIAVLLLIVVVLAFLGVGLWQRRHPLRQERTARAPMVLQAGALMAIALALIASRPTILQAIRRMDLGLLSFGGKLFSRIWVYLRSLMLYFQYPLLGFSQKVRPNGLLLGKHSEFLDLLAEYGIIGFGVFLLSWFGVLYFIGKHLSDKERGFYHLALWLFHVVFLVNPVWEVSSVMVLTVIVPGVLMTIDSEGGRSKR
ncbi:hypothetical protein ABB02_00711 [Clostridiaceae bacterium JG1575]|nr:hypothetical protein ABB02_00711 [Clostridiaceae bacterium JG1575]